MSSHLHQDTQPSVAISRQSERTSHVSVVWPIVAFWAGAAILFAVGGTLNAVRFAEILLRARGGWQSLTLAQNAWLVTAGLFVVCAIISLILALLVAGRFSGGFYASLLFGLLLTLLVPLSALLTSEPDYFRAVCGGLLPAALVLFTLANQSRLIVD